MGMSMRRKEGKAAGRAVGWWIISVIDFREIVQPSSRVRVEALTPTLHYARERSYVIPTA